MILKTFTCVRVEHRTFHRISSIFDFYHVKYLARDENEKSRFRRNVDLGFVSDKQNPQYQTFIKINFVYQEFDCKSRMLSIAFFVTEMFSCNTKIFYQRI